MEKLQAILSYLNAYISHHKDDLGAFLTGWVFSTFALYDFVSHTLEVIVFGFIGGVAGMGGKEFFNYLLKKYNEKSKNRH